jgi:anti-sigma B factor antagonist
VSLLAAELHRNLVRQHRTPFISEDERMSLAITVNGSHVRLGGAVDMTTAPSLRDELTDLINAAVPGGEVRLELGEVSLLDSSGLSALLGAHKLASALDVRLLLAGLPRHVERMLSITGLDAVLHVTR